MIWLVYERATGVVVATITADARPTVMSHHDTMEYTGDKPPVPILLRIKADRSGYEFVQGALGLARERAVALVNRKRTAVQNSGCTTAKGVMQSDETSRVLLSGAVQMAQIAVSQGQEFSMGWTMADNKTAMLTAAELIGAGLSMGSFISTSHAVGVALRERIAAAKTVDEVQAIDIEGAAWTGASAIKMTAAKGVTINAQAKL